MTLKTATSAPQRRIIRPTVFLIALAMLIGLISMISCERGQKTVTLRFKYEPGQKLVYELTQKSNTKVMEADSVLETGTHEINMKIEEFIRRMVDDSIAEVVETDRWTRESKGNKDSVVADTSTKTREMTLYTSPNGKIIDIEFGPDISESSIAYIKDSYDQGFPVFPPGDHAPGYTWTQSTRILLDNEPVEASTTYEISSFAREQGYDCVVISYDGNMVIPIKPSPADTTMRSGVNRIEMTGVMYFAHKEGITISNRDRWVIDADRTEIRNGKERHYKVIYEGDSNLNLKERTMVAADK